MASGFPAALDTLATNHVDDVGEIIYAVLVNDLADAVNKIEATLGINPQSSAADVATRILNLEKINFNIQNVPSYTCVANDVGGCVSMIYATASSVVLPSNTNVPIDIGKAIMIRQGPSAGTVTVSGDAGVTVESRGSSFALAGPVAWVTAIKVGTDTWDLFGDLA